jgi:tetratricopeptide (TPR) repeat protein
MKRKNFVRFITLILVTTFVFSLSAYAQRRPNKKARKLAVEAGKLYNQGRYDDAIVKYAEALSISPYFPQARFFKGSSHYKQQQYDLAVSELNLALSQGVNPLQVYTLRMEAYAAKGDFSSAMKDAQQVVRLEPNNAYYTAFLGKMYLVNNDFQNGINLLNKAIEQGSRDPNVYYFLAVGYNRIGDYQQQGKAADKALKSGTQFSGNAWFLLADSLRRDRKYTDSAQAYQNAINSYKTAISTNRVNNDTEENLYQSYINLSDIYRNLNRFDDAIKTAKEGLSLRPSDGNLHISLTWYYSLAGMREAAVIAGEKAVELAPDQYMAYTNLCRAYLYEGEFFHGKQAFQMATKSFNQAVAVCKKALTMQVNDGETNYYLGRTYFFLDDDKLSKSYYEKSVNGLIGFTNANPDYSDGYYLLGNAYFATGKNEEAIKAYERCLQIAPRFARVRYNLGYVYYKEGNKPAARQQYDILQQLDKDLAKRLLSVIEK